MVEYKRYIPAAEQLLPGQAVHGMTNYSVHHSTDQADPRPYLLNWGKSPIKDGHLAYIMAFIRWILGELQLDFWRTLDGDTRQQFQLHGPQNLYPPRQSTAICAVRGERLAAVLKSAFLSLLDESAVHCHTEISIG
jgi:hypothetical protein